mmetsp:Transcript_9215/g.23026  ORF Transcript_9215/g.23026 Transcript_9215/m.23026 type:complete len:332 (-) Transcript_9215:25-1020(-)
MEVVDVPFPLHAALAHRHTIALTQKHGRGRLHGFRQGLRGREREHGGASDLLGREDLGEHSAEGLVEPKQLPRGRRAHHPDGREGKRFLRDAPGHRLDLVPDQGGHLLLHPLPGLPPAAFALVLGRAVPQVLQHPLEHHVDVRALVEVRQRGHHGLELRGQRPRLFPPALLHQLVLELGHRHSISRRPHRLAAAQAVHVRRALHLDPPRRPPARRPRLRARRGGGAARRMAPRGTVGRGGRVLHVRPTRPRPRRRVPDAVVRRARARVLPLTPVPHASMIEQVGSGHLLLKKKTNPAPTPRGSAACPPGAPCALAPLPAPCSRGPAAPAVF